MKKTWLTLAIALIVCLVTYGNFITRATYAQCAAVCAMVCATRCEGTCYDCTLGECVDKAIQCCDEAARETGPLPACGPGGPGGS